MTGRNFDSRDAPPPPHTLSRCSYKTALGCCNDLGLCQDIKTAVEVFTGKLRWFSRVHLFFVPSLLFFLSSPSALLFRNMYFNIMEYIKQLQEMFCIYPPCSLDLVAAWSHRAGRDTLDIYIQLTPKEAPWWKELNINRRKGSWIQIFHP